MRARDDRGVLAPCALLLSLLASDLAPLLAGLDASSAAEREAAQRALAARVVAADAAEIATAVRTGSPEARARLAEVVGALDPLLPLAADLARDPDPSVAAAGNAALEIAVLRFLPGAAEEPSSPAAVEAALERRGAVRVRIERELANAPLEDVLDLLGEADASLPRFVVDPAFVSRAALDLDVLEGPSFDVVRALLTAHGAGLEPHGFADDSAAGWFVVRAAEATPSSVLDLVASACARFAFAARASERSGAARLLGDLGWPAAIAWMEARWRDAGDAAALDGLARAAQRGAVASAFLHVGERERVLAFALARAQAAPASSSFDRSGSGAFAGNAANGGGASRGDANDDGATRGVAKGDANGANAPGDRASRDGSGGRTSGTSSASAVFAALGAAGPRGVGGEDFSAALAAGLDAAGGREAFLRCVALEAQRSPFESAVPALDRLLARADASPALRLQALRARAASGAATTFELGGVGELAAWSQARGLLEDVEVLARACARFDPALGALASGVTPERVRSLELAGLRARLQRGEVEDAVRLFASVLPGGVVDTGDALRASARSIGVARVRAFLDAARAAHPTLAPRIDRAASIARVSLPLVESALRAELAALDRPSSEDLVVLGALCASELGANARDRLRDLVARGDLDPAALVAALDRAVDALRAERDDTRASSFAKEVRFAARDAKGPLRAALRVGSWPAPPMQPVKSLAAFDRDPARAGL